MILRDTLNLMESSDGDGRRIPFDIKFLKMDLSRKRGGDFQTLCHLEKIGTSTFHKGHEIINVRKYGSTEPPYAIHMRLIFAFRLQGSENFIEVN